MKNPWINLPEQNPYTLAEDRPLLDELTPKLKGKDKLRFEVVPFPFVGDPRRAKVILLSLNPGFEESDLQNNIEHPDLVEADRKNLAFGNVPSFHGLNEKYWYGGLYGYWNPLMKKELIKAVGRERAANSISLINFFPYHSETGSKLTRIWPSLKGILPSQAYSFHLVRTAIDQEKIIVLLRSWDLWEAHVPELMGYPSIRLRNHRQPWLSRNNMSDNGFARMVDAILNG